MYLAIVTLVPGAEPPEEPVDAQVLIDALWTVVLPADRIEHICAATAPDLIELGFYLQADNRLEADLAAQSIGDGACRTAPLLRHWRPVPGHPRPPPNAEKAARRHQRP
ncbi:hypothetical protein ACFXDJ_20130 [Streptomyces sp. NPDC059443]|uniref:hypothetical protein n=1 Tax=unclassified Streptomyces TaxID=2593676 RepID=UPI0036948970